MKIGVTESGDCGVSYCWVKNLLPDYNLITSKDITDELIYNLVFNSEYIVFHCVISGFGGTIFEDGVPRIGETFQGLRKLINSGFPSKNIILQLNPIIPNSSWVYNGFEKIRRVLDILTHEFANEITNVSYAYLTLQPFMIERLKNLGFKRPYWGNIPGDSAKEVVNYIFKEYPSLTFREFTYSNLDDIVKQDLEILNKSHLYDGVIEKVELLGNSYQCKHKCVWCPYTH